MGSTSEAISFDNLSLHFRADTLGHTCMNGDQLLTFKALNFFF